MGLQLLAAGRVAGYTKILMVKATLKSLWLKLQTTIVMVKATLQSLWLKLHTTTLMIKATLQTLLLQRLL